MTTPAALQLLRSHSNPEKTIGMASFGIKTENALGISVPVLRKLGKQIGASHEIAQGLWDSKIHEARILAAFVDRPKWVTETQMESWATDFDSWDICDQICGNLFDATPFTRVKTLEWVHRDQEFVRRAGFVLMAYLAVHNKALPDEEFYEFFPLIQQYATDKRNFIKKAVNWALRQIGKRNDALMEIASQVATDLAVSPDATSRWVGKDALREFDRIGGKNGS